MLDLAENRTGARVGHVTGSIQLDLEPGVLTLYIRTSSPALTPDSDFRGHSIFSLLIESTVNSDLQKKIHKRLLHVHNCQQHSLFLHKGHRKKWSLAAHSWTSHQSKVGVPCRYRDR